MTSPAVPFLARKMQSPPLTDESVYEALKFAFPALTDARVIGDRTGFGGSNVALQRSAVSSGYHPAVYLRSDGGEPDNWATLSLCCAGSARLQIKGTGSHAVRAGTAMLTTSSRWSLESSDYAGMVIRVPKAELSRNLSLVLGHERQLAEVTTIDNAAGGENDLLARLNGLDSLFCESFLASSLYDDALIDIITIWLARWMERRRLPQSDAASRMRAVVARATDLVRQDLQSSTAVRDLARGLGVSERYLQLSFQSTMGMSPKEWILSERLNEARKELGKLSISELAEKYAFSSPSHFSTAFKKRFGAAPKFVADGRE